MRDGLPVLAQFNSFDEGVTNGLAARTVFSGKSTTTKYEDPNPQLSNGDLTALDSGAALNVAWARRAGIISYLPRSARVVRIGL